MSASSGPEPLAAWSTVAPGWERRRAHVWAVSREVGERLVDLLDPGIGDTVLELAAGPGDTGFTAAPRLGTEGVLVSSDFAPAMVEAARRRASELGMENVDFRVLDAQALDFPDASVDGVLCRWGYMLMPDPALALAETARVLRSGGCVAFSVWASAEENPWGSAVGRALIELGLMERPDPDTPGPFRLADIERLRSLVDGAGFDAPLIEDQEVVWRYSSFDDYWAVTADLSFLLTTVLRTYDSSDLAEIVARTRESLQPYADEVGGLAIPGVCRNVLAHKPAA